LSNVFVSGMGIITCLGRGTEETFTSIRNSQSGLSQLQYSDDNRLAAGIVHLTNEELALHTGSGYDLPRAALLGIHAAKEAYLQSGIQHMHQWRVGLVSGCLYGGMDKTEQFYPAFREKTTRGRLRDVVYHTPGSITKLIADGVNANEFYTTLATGTSSALSSIMMGCQLIQHNYLDVVFAGGTDSLSQFMIRGLRSENLIDSMPCRPFDASCAGLNPGEGAAFVVLISERVMRKESASAVAVISGFGSDNFVNNNFPSALKEEAAFNSMTKAFQMADLTSNDIDYVNLFGTGVPDHDLIESAAMRNVFGETFPSMSSTKAFTGYTSGACGAVESVISLMGLSNQCIFASLGFENPIPEVGILPVRNFKTEDVRHSLVNSFSTLGNCASVLFSKIDQTKTRWE
jgi:3-oxoacyl-(acyl-carrier-protein) synthase